MQLHYLSEAGWGTVNAGELAWQPHMSYDNLSKEILENIDFIRKEKN